MFFPSPPSVLDRIEGEEDVKGKESRDNYCIPFFTVKLLNIFSSS